MDMQEQYIAARVASGRCHRRVDANADGYTYIGISLKNTQLEGEAGWYIYRVDATGNSSPAGNSFGFDKTWADRLTYTYAN